MTLLSDRALASSASRSASSFPGWFEWPGTQSTRLRMGGRSLELSSIICLAADIIDQ